MGSSIGWGLAPLGFTDRWAQAIDGLLGIDMGHDLALWSIDAHAVAKGKPWRVANRFCQWGPLRYLMSIGCGNFAAVVGGIPTQAAVTVGRRQPSNCDRCPKVAHILWLYMGARQG